MPNTSRSESLPKYNPPNRATMGTSELMCCNGYRQSDVLQRVFQMMEAK